MKNTNPNDDKKSAQRARILDKFSKLDRPNRELAGLALILLADESVQQLLQRFQPVLIKSGN